MLSLLPLFSAAAEFVFVYSVVVLLTVVAVLRVFVPHGAASWDVVSRFWCFPIGGRCDGSHCMFLSFAFADPALPCLGRTRVLHYCTTPFALSRKMLAWPMLFAITPRLLHRLNLALLIPSLAAFISRADPKEDIGVKTSFQCDLTLAVDSLRSLALCATPMDKMLQVKARTSRHFCSFFVILSVCFFSESAVSLRARREAGPVLTCCSVFVRKPRVGCGTKFVARFVELGAAFFVWDARNRSQAGQYGETAVVVAEVFGFFVVFFCELSNTNTVPCQWAIELPSRLYLSVDR